MIDEEEIASTSTQEASEHHSELEQHIPQAGRGRGRGRSRRGRGRGSRSGRNTIQDDSVSSSTPQDLEQVDHGFLRDVKDEVMETAQTQEVQASEKFESIWKNPYFWGIFSGK